MTGLVGVAYLLLIGLYAVSAGVTLKYGVRVIGPRAAASRLSRRSWVLFDTMAGVCVVSVAAGLLAAASGPRLVGNDALQIIGTVHFVGVSAVSYLVQYPKGNVGVAIGRVMVSSVLLALLAIAVAAVVTAAAFACLNI